MKIDASVAFRGWGRAWRATAGDLWLLILPDGQITEFLVQPFLQKHFCFSETQITAISLPIPPPLRGALRNVTNAERDAVDADGAKDDGA
jgi:hypothetical protein